MSNDTFEARTRQDRWARFRFSIIGPLLSAPPESGELQAVLAGLAKKQWRHPINGLPVTFSVSTIERWFYHARRKQDPIGALRTKRRLDAGGTRQLNTELKETVRQQYREHPSWSYQLHSDNVASIVKKSPELGPMPSYNTIRRFMRSQGLTRQPRVRKRDTLGARDSLKSLGKSRGTKF